MATTLLILGASGDLSARLLLPALGQLLQREPDRRVNLLGAGAEELSHEEWRRRVRAAFDTAGARGQAHRLHHTKYTRADVTDPNQLRSLLEGLEGRVVIYFALPPAVTRKACEALRKVQLGSGTVLALEKPFGDGVESAKELNDLLLQLVPAERIFRVDHFLGRSTLLNILGVRLSNRAFTPIWTAEHVESVDIRFDESLALEARAGYYDHAGALEDMIQSHLLQVLALVALEPPATLDTPGLSTAMIAALRATHLWEDSAQNSIRARYTAGTIGERVVCSYVDEEGVDPARNTETFAQITCEVRTERWAGVPFRLRSGKALTAKVSTVTLNLRPVRHLANGFEGEVPDGGKLTFSLGPDELRLELNMTGGADPFALQRGTLVSRFGEGQLLAYSEVLSELLDGENLLSVPALSVQECWRIIDPVRQAWAADEVPMREYVAGSLGPEE